MPSLLRCRFLSGVLFLSSLSLCLWLGTPHTNAIAPDTVTQKHLNRDIVESPIPNPQSPIPLLLSSSDQLVQQGVDRYHKGDYKGAIADWQQALQDFQRTNSRTNQAIVIQNLARAYQQLGQSNVAISYWEQVIRLYRQTGDQSQLGRALTEQAQAYSRIGQYRKAIALLCNADESHHCVSTSALQLAVQAKDPIAEAAALGTLGNAYRMIGEYDLAQKNLEAGQQLAEKLEQPTYRLSALNSLGILHTSLAQVNYRKAELAQQGSDASLNPNNGAERKDRKTELTQQGSDTDNEAAQFQRQGQDFDRRAIAYLKNSLKLAQAQNNAPEQLRSLLALIPAYQRTNETAQATAAWQEANRLLAEFPDSRDRVFAAIDLAKLLQPNLTIARQQCSLAASFAQAEPLFQQAVAMARRIQDARAESFALGELGRLYECRQDWAQALDLTRQASLAADQNLEAKDSLYLWEWQTGRILRQQWEASGRSSSVKLSQAIAAYERSIKILESIRGDILTAARDIQFDFRDTIDPIHRELIELKLSRETPVQTGLKSLSDSSNQKGFRSILQTVDSLKLAELQNYFGNECIVAIANQDSIDLGIKHAAAVFNTIILGGKTAVILSLPNGQQKFSWIEIPQAEITRQINQFRRELEEARFSYDPKPAQQVYNWVIRPFEADLQQAKVNTLVFVQDGIFRTVPMSALHDGQQFLIQRYAIATTPSLTLTDPKPLKRENLRVLALGLSKVATVEGKTFDALPNVSTELTGIRDLIPGSKKLLDEEFTRDRLKQELSETVYPILHVATHGKFATDSKDTFIVTGDAKKLTFNELDRLIRSVSRNTEPLELLSLTACETAAGNDRSALGLAGVAIQAGARSALASLWSVNDATTARLTTEFYKQLQDPQLNKAEALQAVQKAFIQDKIEGLNTSHPAYWSAFVLIGNWL